MPAPAPLAALLALAVARAAAEIHETHYTAHTKYPQNERSVRNIGSPSGCQYEGRWYREGAPVAAREACLRCACGRGALSCARRACAAPPDPLPRRCYLRHRKGACCPELHCPEGVTTLEQSASARFESEEAVSGAGAGGHACVEGGVVYAAGSAMGGRVACETCFCLAGARRCVRPRCLPPPPACSARPAPGACCPARYYCDAPAHPPSTEPPAHRSHDCLVDGAWIREGEPVAGGAANCSACFCLRGAVRCQPLACAPPLHGCEPLLRAGQCCPHQYHCPPRGRDHVIVSHDDRLTSQNSLSVTRADDRSFHSAAPSTFPPRSPPAAAAAAGPTTKVKRKTSESPPPATATTAKTKKDITKPTSISTQTIKHTTPAETVATTETLSMEKLSAITANEQPEGSAKIMINGTINCTAELSSSPDGIGANASRPREPPAVPAPASSPPAVPAPASSPTPPPAAAPQPYTSNPNEIITDSIIGSVFDENETFTINVTSSLRTNVSRPVATPARPAAAPPLHPPAHVNATNRVKGDYDYDYTEPTLPPSLPNLKIIPFVAADAVVDEEAPSKDVLTFPIMDREDKFPVYYPMIETKQTTANRREDVYSPIHYPVFVSSKAKVPASAPAPAPAPPRPAPPPPPPEPAARPPDSTLKLNPPAINMFSPPVETEGGFVPKGPGIIDEYYAVYPSTHSPPSLPHLTTSMQLNTVKGECVTADGRRVGEGAALDVSCARCACAWGELRCAPRACPAVACRDRDRGAAGGNLDPCCPETICIQNNTTTVAPTSTTTVQSTHLESKEPLILQSEILLFDPPPDRSAPPEPPTTERTVKIETTKYSTVPSIYIDNIELTTTKTSTNPTTAAAHTELPATPAHSAYADNATSAEDYEEEEEDEGFSFGSVLKLLLSESYDPTSPAPPKKPAKAPVRITTAAVTTTITATTTTKAATTTARPPRPPTRPPVTAARPPSTTIRTRPVKPSVTPFIPLPHRFDTLTHEPYTPPKKTFSPHTTVNKIDHLVLGEATAIKKSTPRPSTAAAAARPGGPPRPARDPPPLATVAPPAPAAAPTPAASQPAEAAAAGAPGLLKLAGCNIYGRMYRVGRIIAELSSPCQECRCTELGVHCRPLRC